MADKSLSKANRYGAFINIPYDDRYEAILLAFVAGLCGFGLIPRATLEIPTSQRRLDRIEKLLDKCRYSFHDLSCIEPRFNMPFELGLAVHRSNRDPHRHDFVVFEAKRFRLQKTLSDLNGTEVHCHGGSGIGVLRELPNVLTRTRHKPTVKNLRDIYMKLNRFAAHIKTELETKSLFDARPFAELVFAASKIARKTIPSLQKRQT
jgi:hypothetical protein